MADGVLGLTDLVAKLTANPARILNLPCGLVEGAPADLTLIDPDLVWTVDSRKFLSLSRNTPFDGWEVKGRAVMTIVGGRIVHEIGRVDEELSR